MDKDSNCIFCKIIEGAIPAKLLFEDSEHIAISDINPQAPTHALVIPKTHVRNIAEFEDAAALGRLFQAAKKVAAAQGVLEKGFRLVVNTGDDGGQTVDHLHIHVVGGRQLGWPPG